MISRPPARARLRVLHLLRTLDPASGGPVTYWRAASAALDASAVDAQARAFASSGSAVRSVAGQWRWLKRHAGDYDAVHIHGIFSWPLALGARAAQRARVPYVVSSHGHLYPWSLSRKPARKALYLALGARQLLRDALAVVATCEREAEVLRSFDAALRIRVVSPGLPPGTPAASTRVPAGNGLRLVFVNRLAEQKGVPVLLDAMARLAAAKMPAALDVVGDGAVAYRAALESHCEAIGLSSRIRWRGFLEGADKAAALAGADVFVLPSNMENFSFATAEALAAGLPAVVSDAVALADEIRHYQCGTVVPVGDAEALAAALERYADPDLLRRQSANALRCAQERFGLDAMKLGLERLYTEAAGARA